MKSGILLKFRHYELPIKAMQPCSALVALPHGHETAPCAKALYQTIVSVDLFHMQIKFAG